MNPTTALAIILSGASLAFSLLAQGRNGRRYSVYMLTARACALVVASIGLLRILALLFGWDAGIDQYFFRSQVNGQFPFPSRIAPNVASNFLLVGGALLFADKSGRRVRIGVECAVIVAACGALLAIMGYVFNTSPLYRIGVFIPMALNTAFAFLLLTTGMLISHTDRGFLAVFAGKNAGGIMARRLMPAVFLLPILFSWLELHGEHSGYFNDEMGNALFALATTLSFTLLVCWCANFLFNAELQRQSAEDTCRENEQRFRHAFEEGPLGMAIVGLDGRFQKVNTVLCDMLGYSSKELIQLTFPELTHPDEIDRDVNRVKQMIAEERSASYRVEKRYLKNDRSFLWISLSSAIIRDPVWQAALFHDHV